MVALAGGADSNVYTHIYSPASSGLGLLSLCKNKTLIKGTISVPSKYNGIQDLGVIYNQSE